MPFQTRPDRFLPKSLPFGAPVFSSPCAADAPSASHTLFESTRSHLRIPTVHLCLGAPPNALVSGFLSDGSSSDNRVHRGSPMTGRRVIDIRGCGVQQTAGRQMRPGVSALLIRLSCVGFSRSVCESITPSLPQCPIGQVEPHCCCLAIQALILGKEEDTPSERGNNQKTGTWGLYCTICRIV